jgi:rhamnulokinase
MPDKKFISFDIGAESGRCVVASLRNNRILLDEVHRFPTHNIKYVYGFYWDILAIYKEIITGLKNAQKKFGSEFESIGIDTWAVDYVLIDDDGRILGYPYHYRDDRTEFMMEKAFQILPKEKIYEKTGIQFAQFNTLFQLLSEKYRKSNFLNFADKMLLIPDFLNYLLTGQKKSEFTNSSTTNLLDLKTKNWSWELIDAFDFPRKIYPEIVAPGTVLGKILPSIAEQTELSKNVSVTAVASHDTASAVVSVPALNNNWAYLSSGTWSLIGIELKEPVVTSQAMEYNFTNEGGYNSIRFLKNIVGLWTLQECRRYWQEKSQIYSYPELVSLAIDCGHANAWIDLNDIRFLKAGEMPEKIIKFLNETEQIVKPNVGFITRVILESLAFSYKFAIDEIKIVTGKKIDSLHVVGGGIKNELLMQLTADALNCNVITGPVEGAIVGNIGVQAIASGAIADIHTLRMITADSFQLKKFEPKNLDYFLENEQNYKSILNQDNAVRS